MHVCSKRSGDISYALPRAVIFDLGGTLVDWKESRYQRWLFSYDHLVTILPKNDWPERDVYANAMHEAERAHWERVEEKCWSGSSFALLCDGFQRLGRHVQEEELAAALNGYARAIAHSAVVFPDALETLHILKKRGYRLGLLSNTWWAPEWHNADLAFNGFTDLLDEVAYSSDLAYSKPHPSVFLKMAACLGVEPSACVMIGDRMIDDISGALSVGMRAVWKQNDNPWSKVEHIVPTAAVTCLAELPALLHDFDGPTPISLD